MAENRRDKDKRFYLNRSQLVLLGSGFTVASLIIFFLGMLVGKGIEERKMIKADEPLVKIPVKPVQPVGGATEVAQPKEELTFYDTLSKSPDAPPRDKVEAKEVKPEPKLAKAETQDGQAEKKKEPPPPLKAVEKIVEKVAPPAAQAKKSEPSETAKGKETAKGWTVQVNAFPDERSAKMWVDRLKNRGYNAYVTEVLTKGRVWYRVRVGRYDSREEAEKAEEILRTKENFTKAFATAR